MPETTKHYDLSYTQNRELSWLKFNGRVLEEASDPTVPLMERLRFISIFTSNLDEFFMVRVGSLFDLSIMTPKEVENKSGRTPKEQLECIYSAVRPLIATRDTVYHDLNQQLVEKGVRDVPYESLAGTEKSAIQQYYKDNIRPLLSPQIIDPSHPFPHLKNKVLYAAAVLTDKNRAFLGIVGLPDSIPPILFLPNKSCEFVRTETILAAHLKKIFRIYTVEEQSIISVTRNADLSYDEEKFDDDIPDFRKHMEKLLKLRERLAPVRLEMQGFAPRLQQLLCQRLKLQNSQCYHSTCPLSLDYAYLLNRCDPSLYYPPHIPQYPLYLHEHIPIWEQVRQRDVLLFYPYQSMQPFLELLRQSARDPQVLSIKITIYRLAKNSGIIQALCDAAQNGKEVTVIMELRARFDEQNNIEWASILEDAGCKILYGPQNYKCHSKICLITRKEASGLRCLTQIGTGNYNEKTSALYTDFSLLTCDPVICEDAVSFFQNMLIGNLYGTYTKLLVAPISMKTTILRLIDGEIARGTKGRIILKLNSITERDLIDKLKEASCAGVQIDLIVRGICCLVPGIPGKTETIRVTSIVGRFLEHSRVYSFGEGDLQQIYISSADMMTRNQVRRVEIACPISSPELKSWFSSYLNLLLSDTTKARRLLPNGNYIDLRTASASAVNSQQYYEEHPVVLEPTVMPQVNKREGALRKFWKKLPWYRLPSQK